MPRPSFPGPAAGSTGPDDRGGCFGGRHPGLSPERHLPPVLRLPPCVSQVQICCPLKSQDHRPVPRQQHFQGHKTLSHLLPNFIFVASMHFTQAETEFFDHGPQAHRSQSLIWAQPRPPGPARSCPKSLPPRRSWDRCSGSMAAPPGPRAPGLSGKGRGCPADGPSGSALVGQEGDPFPSGTFSGKTA